MGSRGLNKVQLIGNLGRDPEGRYTPQGKAITTFSLAVNGRGSETQWFNIVTWEQLAENCARYLAKGKPVYIEGRLQTRSWDAPDGSKRYKIEVVATDVIFLGGSGDGAGSTEEVGGDAAGLEELGLSEDDLPF